MVCDAVAFGKPRTRNAPRSPRDPEQSVQYPVGQFSLLRSHYGPHSHPDRCQFRDRRRSGRAVFGAGLHRDQCVSTGLSGCGRGNLFTDLADETSAKQTCDALATRLRDTAAPVCLVHNASLMLKDRCDTTRRCRSTASAVSQCNRHQCTQPNFATPHAQGF